MVKEIRRMAQDGRRPREELIFYKPENEDIRFREKETAKRVEELNKKINKHKREYLKKVNPIKRKKAKAEEIDFLILEDPETLEEKTLELKDGGWVKTDLEMK